MGPMRLDFPSYKYYRIRTWPTYVGIIHLDDYYKVRLMNHNPCRGEESKSFLRVRYDMLSI